MAEARVQYGRGSCSVWQRLVYCLTPTGLCSVRQSVMLASVLRRFDSVLWRLMAAGRGFPPSRNTCLWCYLFTSRFDERSRRSNCAYNPPTQTKHFSAKYFKIRFMGETILSYIGWQDFTRNPGKKGFKQNVHFNLLLKLICFTA